MHNLMNCLLLNSIFLFYLNIFKFIGCFNLYFNIDIDVNL